MGKIYRLILITLLINASCTIATAQQNFFKDDGENSLQKTNGIRLVFPEKYRAASLDNEAMKSFLWSLPAEKNILAKQQAPILILPMPDGSNARFRVWESSIMHPALEAKFPEIKTFLGQGIDDPYAVVRLAYNPYSGLSAQIRSVHGNIYIDPFAKGDIGNYISYYTRDNKRSPGFSCEAPDQEFERNLIHRPQAGECRGTALFTYRLAVACTGEYAVAVCAPSAPTVNATLAAIVASVNRVVGVYETELSIRMVLVANETDLIYLDGATDPYTNSSASATPTQNQTNLDTKIGSANYDIGHVFTTGSGGQASLAVVCDDLSKARGTTGIANPVGDNFDIDYVAHEMGHQFGANHSFNGVVGTCGTSSNSSTAFEVGSGTSIMSYAGICGSDNIQLHSDAFFHPISFDEIILYVENDGGSCKVSTPTLNTIPVIAAMDNNGISIPISTPFTLTGSATDPDGDPITYCWEEWDLGPSTAWNGGNANTSSPLFKSRIPKTTGSRTFPDMAVILAGFPANPPATGPNKGETLPTIARPLKFRLTVRDNRPGGGGVTSGGAGCQTGFINTFQINTVATSGPFAITAPNGAESIAGGSAQAITWNVVGTNTAPINCANVKITLSTDGGLTFPNVLATSTANDGTETLSFPSLPTATARIKIEAIGNIFFDISNNNFTITGPASSFDFDNPAPVNVACPAPASASTTLNTVSNGGFLTAVNLSATGAPAGTNVTFGTNPVIPGNSTTVTLNGTNTLLPGTYTITVTGVAGSITRTRDISFVVQTGTGPVINTQPATQSICTGSPVTFSVAATGALFYQWQFSSDGGNNYVNIPGAISATYAIASVQVANGGRYRVNVIGACNTTTSSAAILTAQSAPAITAQPQDATICIGSNNIFSVTATGANLTYQWQQSIDGGANFTNVGGPTSSTYTVSSATLTMNNYQYRVIVAGTCTPSVTSTAAVLTVAGPVVINTQPEDMEMCSDRTANFTVAATSSLPVIYQWQSSSNGGADWQDVVNSGAFSGATSATLTIANPGTTFDGYLFRALLTSEACSNPVTSASANLTVRRQPTVQLSASPLLSLLPGQTTTLLATPSGSSVGGTITYQWLYNSTPLTETLPNHLVTVEETGDYQVIISEPWPSSLICTNESAIVTILGTASSNLFIYPSPNTGQFTVSYFNTGNANTSRTVTVFDSKGNRVHHQKFNISGPYTLLHLDIKPLNGGIYYVVVGDADGKKLAKGKVLIVN